MRAMLVGVVVFALPVTGAAKDVHQVEVVNPAERPVPVAIGGIPTVTLEGPVDVNVVRSPVVATQGGAWSVGLVGTPTVALAPGAALEARVYDRARNAFHAVKTVTHFDPFPEDHELVIADSQQRRLVIETVSARIGLPGSYTPIALSIATTLNGTTAEAFFLPVPLGGGGMSYQFGWAQALGIPTFVVPATPVRIYSDPSPSDPTRHVVGVGCGPSESHPPSLSWQCIVEVSGYFVPND